MEKMGAGTQGEIALASRVANGDCHNGAISVKTITGVGVTYDNIQLQSRANVTMGSIRAR
jgi:hypothetical protein